MDDNRSSHILAESTTAGVVRNQPSLVSTMVWFFGKLNILIGLASLGVATVILAVFGRAGDRRNPAASLGLISLILGAFTLFFIRRSKEEAPRIAFNPD